MEDADRRRGGTGDARPLLGARVLRPFAPHQGRHDGRSDGPAPEDRKDPRRDAPAFRAGDRPGDLSRRLLQDQGPPSQTDLRRSHRSFRRESAGHDRRSPHAQGRGTEDREPRRHGRVRKAGHLRRYARPPDLEPLGVRQDQDTRGDREGPSRKSSPPPLDHVQRSARHVRPESL